jgi:hypothetical protein
MNNKIYKIIYKRKYFCLNDGSDSCLSIYYMLVLVDMRLLSLQNILKRPSQSALCACKLVDEFFSFINQQMQFYFCITVSVM